MPSDVIWAAGIAVVGSGLSSGITATVAIAVARQNTAVELAKLKTELDKLRVEQQDTERSNRQNAYGELMAKLEALDTMGLADSPEDRDQVMRYLEHISRDIGTIELVAPKPVRQATVPLTEQLARLVADVDRAVGGGDPYPLAFKRVYWAHRTQFGEKETSLTDAMRADVTKGIYEETEEDAASLVAAAEAPVVTTRPRTP